MTNDVNTYVVLTTPALTTINISRQLMHNAIFTLPFMMHKITIYLLPIDEKKFLPILFMRVMIGPSLLSFAP